MRKDLKLEGWTIRCEGAGLADDFIESVFFLGNGRLGIRGFMPFDISERPVQRGMFAAGVFGEIKPGITDIVNLPVPVFDEIYIDGRRALPEGGVDMALDMRAATLSAACTLTNGVKRVELEYLRFLPKNSTGLIAQRFVLRPRADMELGLRGGIYTGSCNCPVPDDQRKENAETICLARQVSAEGLDCVFGISGTGLTVRERAEYRTGFGTLEIRGADAAITGAARAGEEVRVDKLACVLTSRDLDPLALPMPVDWELDALHAGHRAAWERAWQGCDFALPGGDTDVQTGLRFAMYNLMASCSARDPGVSIGARGLTHARYKGCYFWDTDLFMLPFFIENDPVAARSLCEYRVRSLGAAKEHSRRMNTRGARYPWMAAFDGSEQCETWDIGCSEVHITADVAYALGEYCKARGDEAFYLDSCAEVFIETARFWLSRCTWVSEERAKLLFCKGPDEYCGITHDNLFSLAMIQHDLELAEQAAADLAEKRPELYAALGLSDLERADFRRLRESLVWPRDPVTGRLRQDESFHLLEPVDIKTVKPDAEASYHRVCFDRLQRYRLIKQADLLLVMTRLPELFTQRQKREAWEDFEPVCLHDSTLSWASHALFALQNGMEQEGLDFLRRALLLDLRDIMSNTGKEGLHLACMGEAWSAARALYDLKQSEHK